MFFDNSCVCGVVCFYSQPQVDTGGTTSIKTSASTPFLKTKVCCLNSMRHFSYFQHIVLVIIVVVFGLSACISIFPFSCDLKCYLFLILTKLITQSIWHQKRDIITQLVKTKTANLSWFHCWFLIQKLFSKHMSCDNFEKFNQIFVFFRMLHLLECPTQILIDR